MDNFSDPLVSAALGDGGPFLLYGMDLDAGAADEPVVSAGTGYTGAVHYRLAILCRRL
ncbi:hypothetical protein D3C79_1014900 [compost metagenome]